MGNLSTALVHTLLGMGTVFIILILISLVISLFKFIPAIQNMFAKKSEKAPEAPVKVDTPVVIQEEEQTDDLELVAVITAAVAAAMGTENTDGFIVRSIRRSSKNRW